MSARAGFETGTGPIVTPPEPGREHLSAAHAAALAALQADADARRQ